MSAAQKQDIDLAIKRLEYGEADRPQHAVLTIETSKHYNGGLISDATVYWVGAHSRQNTMALHGDGGDYRKRLFNSARTVKATQRAIDRQHAEVFTPEVVAGLVQAAHEHYARYVRDGVDSFRNTYHAEVVSA